jgi:alcohol dehydrogenase
MPTKVIFGEDKFFELKSFIENKKFLVISENFLEKIGITKYFSENFENNYYLFDDVKPNPPSDMVDKAADFARMNNIEIIIGLGGGSALDTAKAVACMLDKENSIVDYLNGDVSFSERKVKLIAIPTTSGTGSEVTNVGVYTDITISEKKPLVSQYFWPDIAIVDPKLTYSMPPRVTAVTGLDALTHAIESYWALGTQTISETLALETIKLIFEYLPKAFDNPNDQTAREKMSLASLMAGMAFSQTRTTAAHAISYPLTNIYNIEHGLACALTLPSLIKYTYEPIKEKMDKLVKYLEMNNIEDLSNKIETMMKNFNLSIKLKDYGIKEEEIEKIADISMKAAIINLLPKKIEKENLLKLLKSIL